MKYGLSFDWLEFSFTCLTFFVLQNSKDVCERKVFIKFYSLASRIDNEL
jgi:hypothetical protein